MQKIKSLLGLDCSDLWRQCSFWIVLVLAAYAFDTLSTIHFMTIGGIDFELHPLVRQSAFILGPVAGTVLSAFFFKSVVTISLALYLKRLRIWILTAPVIPSIIAGIFNFAHWNI